MPPALDPAALALPVLQDPACAAYVRELLRTRWTDDHDHDAVARVRACVDARSIVFVAVHHGNFPSLEFLAPALRERGHTTLAIYLQGDAHGEGFDHTERCGGSLSRLAALLRALPDGTAIYLQAHARWVWLGQLVAAVAPRLRLVQEIWDWMDQFAPAAHAQDFVDDGVFTHAELALMRGAEAWVRDHAYAVVHKHGGREQPTWPPGAAARECRIMPCPPRAWSRPPLRREPGPWRIVHVGQIKSQHAPVRAFGDLQLASLFQRWTRQGLYVSAYPGVAPAADALVDYEALARRDRAFALHRHRSIGELVGALHGAHDYGLLLYPFPRELAVGRAHLRTALASKLFTYVAAGLPVLVSPELAYMAELVERHGIGLVVEERDHDRLRERLDVVDYPALQRAVRAAQSEFHIERFVPALVELLTACGPVAAEVPP